ncbi:MAG TPA: deoxyribodipyrimidine photo-lyase, partial [Kiritimatiellia bacterium]|nr:deoxyribodipyrimidine photo-lyase [Kiritimatiellia bacterium]
MIHPARIQPQNDLPLRRGRYVLYWMQQAQRAEFNDALEYAIDQANTLALPVLAAFALAPFPDANARPYRFMLEGLRETRNRLAARGIGFCLRKGAPEEVIPPLAKNAALLVGDVGYLPVQRDWRRAVGERIRCPFVLVETDAIVPVAEASDHAEFAARTLRPKIHRKLPLFLKRPRARRVATPSLNLVRDSLSLDDPEALCRAIGADDSVPAADHPPEMGEPDLHGELTSLYRQGLRDQAAGPEFLQAMKRILDRHAPSRLPFREDFTSGAMAPGWQAVRDVWALRDGYVSQTEFRHNTRFM